MITANMAHSGSAHIYRVKTQTVANRFLELEPLLSGNSLNEYIGDKLKFNFSTSDGEFLIVRGVLESRGNRKYSIRVLECLFQA